ncbi:ubiquitin thioesterase OTU1-like [Drosophila obscura]|uniref:ubiquitin thioesterase OTU1-like n=1 Tax=Drosophila obscura TaxID=7282 RepID=UPI000BA0E495|nr:ubiquitin thioesterase OTU1-like [Drosophila obscura]
MTRSFSVMLKSSKGEFILNGLKRGTTLGELKTIIAQTMAIPEPLQLHLLIGCPPQRLDLSQDRDLKTVGIKSGDTLILEEKAGLGTGDEAPVTATATATQATVCSMLANDEALARRLQAEGNVGQQGLDNEMPDQEESSGSTSGSFNGIVLKKEVPADNSCLFTSIRFVLNGKLDDEGSELMRHIVAQEVSADADRYNDAVLGKSNADYCAWIQKPDSWGGAIEVAVLSNYYGIEIDVVDIQNAIINRFGEDKNFGMRVFILYNGIHYDPLYMDYFQNESEATIFPVEEMGVYHQAKQIAFEAHASGQFINVEKLAVRCLVCDAALLGRKQAQKHYKSTGHKKFEEM